MIRHADRYRIDWLGERILADPKGRTEDSRNFGWANSYVIYTESHEDGECEAFVPENTTWPVVNDDA